MIIVYLAINLLKITFNTVIYVIGILLNVKDKVVSIGLEKTISNEESLKRDF